MGATATGHLVGLILRSCRSPTIIIGAGLTGLSCASHLHRQGQQTSEIFEAGAAVGGTARSVQRASREGLFTFDVTGHWLHLRDSQMRLLVDQLLGETPVEVERHAVIHSHGTMTPYPFQTNTHGLPSKVVADCLLGFFRA